MRLNRRLTRSGTGFEKNNSDVKVQQYASYSYPLKIKMIHRRKDREGRSEHLQRIIGKMILLSVCFGGTLIVSGNVAFAYVPNNGMAAYSRTLRRNNPSQTRLLISSSKITAEQTNQANATNSTSSDVNSIGGNVIVQQSLDNSNQLSTHKTYRENFFREEGKSDVIHYRRPDDMYDLESLLVDEDAESNDVPYFGASTTSREYEEIAISSSENDSRINNKTQSKIDPFEEKSSEYDSTDILTNGTRPPMLRRIRPLKTIKRIFGGSSSEQNNTTQKDDNDNIQTKDDSDFEINTNTNDIDSDNEDIADDDSDAKDSFLRKLWRKRNARTLEESIRRERTDTLAFLMNKAIVNANPSQERSYVERSLMGLINGLAEEVEDLDIDISTTSKTPFWRKEVDEIRINFSRLGFRPLQLGGTNSVIEVVDANNDGSSSNVAYTDSLDALVTTSSDVGGINELTFTECADEGFDRIDEDGSGTLDKDELAQALNSISGLKTDKDSIQELASDLVLLYDDNGDGVVDREEYKQMVEDMAKLRAQKDVETKEDDVKNPFVAVKDSIQSVSEGISNRAGEVVSAARDKYFSEKNQEDEDETEMGSIVLSKVNMDLRRLAFGAIPVVKKITPGGPLILEPFTATVTASFSREDVMGSFLLDAALRRLVARSLRVRIRSYRDLVEGALFVGRRWKMTCKTAPVVEVLELSNVEFDSRDKLVVTGRARIRADPDAPVVTSTFKLRTKIGTRKNGQVIKLKEPELAFVFECPKALENGLAVACETFGLPPPKRPEPYYSFFPIYSPFKVDDDTGGFDMGEDNCIRSIFVKNGKLRFEMSVVLRPGRFLGNHYLAFTVPQRTFIITMDRVWNGVGAARKNKQVADREKKKIKKEETTEDSNESSSTFSVSSSEESTTESMSPSTSLDLVTEAPRKRWGIFKTIKENTPTPKSFYARFVEGYTMFARVEEATNERITNDISDWFGRQGLRGNDDTSLSEDKTEEDEDKLLE